MDFLCLCEFCKSQREDILTTSRASVGEGCKSRQRFYAELTPAGASIEGQSDKVELESSSKKFLAFTLPPFSLVDGLVLPIP